jgi:hypothetical protein
VDLVTVGEDLPAGAQVNQTLWRTPARVTFRFVDGDLELVGRAGGGVVNWTSAGTVTIRALPQFSVSENPLGTTLECAPPTSMNLATIPDSTPWVWDHARSAKQGERRLIADSVPTVQPRKAPGVGMWAGPHASTGRS